MKDYSYNMQEIRQRPYATDYVAGQYRYHDNSTYVCVYYHSMSRYVDGIVSIYDSISYGKRARVARIWRRHNGLIDLDIYDAIDIEGRTFEATVFSDVYRTMADAIRAKHEHFKDRK